jgi:hypothetical protein
MSGTGSSKTSSTLHVSTTGSNPTGASVLTVATSKAKGTTITAIVIIIITTICIDSRQWNSYCYLMCFDYHGLLCGVWLSWFAADTFRLLDVVVDNGATRVFDVLGNGLTRVYGGGMSVTGLATISDGVRVRSNPFIVV